MSGINEKNRRLILVIMSCIIVGVMIAFCERCNADEINQDTLTVLGKGFENNINKILSAKGSFVIMHEGNMDLPETVPHSDTVDNYIWEFSGRDAYEYRGTVKDCKIFTTICAIDDKYTYIYNPILRDGSIHKRDISLFRSDISHKLFLSNKYSNNLEDMPLNLFAYTKAKIVGTEKIGDDECYRIEGEDPISHIIHKWWLDPVKGFSIIKYTWTSGDISAQSPQYSRNRFEYTAMYFTKYDNDIWLPSKIVVTSYMTKKSDGSEVWMNRDTFETLDLKVNCEIPISDFSITFPKDANLFKDNVN